MSEQLIGWLFVFCLFPGVIALTIFEKKGRSGWHGLLLGCCLSYLGVIIALFVPKNRQYLVAKQDKELERRRKTLGMIRGTMKSCNNCGEIVEMDAVKCRYCGKYV